MAETHTDPDTTIDRVRLLGIQEALIEMALNVDGDQELKAKLLMTAAHAAGSIALIDQRSVLDAPPSTTLQFIEGGTDTASGSGDLGSVESGANLHEVLDTIEVDIAAEPGVSEDGSDVVLGDELTSGLHSGGRAILRLHKDLVDLWNDGVEQSTPIDKRRLLTINSDKAMDLDGVKVALRLPVNGAPSAVMLLLNTVLQIQLRDVNRKFTVDQVYKMYDDSTGLSRSAFSQAKKALCDKGILVQLEDGFYIPQDLRLVDGRGSDAEDVKSTSDTASQALDDGAAEAGDADISERIVEAEVEVEDEGDTANSGKDAGPEIAEATDTDEETPDTIHKLWGLEFRVVDGEPSVLIDGSVVEFIDLSAHVLRFIAQEPDGAVLSLKEVTQKLQSISGFEGASEGMIKGAFREIRNRFDSLGLKMHLVDVRDHVNPSLGLLSKQSADIPEEAIGEGAEAEPEVVDAHNSLPEPEDGGVETSDANFLLHTVWGLGFEESEDGFVVHIDQLPIYGFKPATVGILRLVASLTPGTALSPTSIRELLVGTDLEDISEDAIVGCMHEIKSRLKTLGKQDHVVFDETNRSIALRDKPPTNRRRDEDFLASRSQQ